MPDISVALIIKIVVIVAAVGCAFATAVSVKNKIGGELGRAHRLIKAINDATEENMSQPMSFTVVDPTILQRVAKDFPEFDDKLAKSIIENAVYKHFLVINGEESPDNLEGCSNALIETLRAKAADNASSPKPIHYDNIVIHRSQITGYRKNLEVAAVTYQVALEYLTNGSKAQHIYDADYTYYLSVGDQGENVSLICQHCGAPIDTTGDKVCPYCGAEIHTSIERTWKVSRIGRVI